MTIKGIIKKLIPSFLLSFYHYLLALFGAVVFGFPSNGLIVIGVTGTSGKSTTVDFVTRILQEAGHKVASVSSIRFKIGDKEWENKYKMTMPGRFVMQKFLRQAKKADCKYVVLEVTSEGIKQYRHKFISFKTVVLTNLSKEHIESHGGFENYKNAKLKLFKETKNIHIINIADNNAECFWNTQAIKKIGFRYKGQDVKVKNIESNTEIIEADDIIASSDELRFNINSSEFSLNLIGEFNIYNALAAVAVGVSERIPLDICKQALKKAKGISGRMELVVQKPFIVIVDYAHTPEQLESCYKSLQDRPLICVLGSCGGGRDKWKRPVLGQVAKEYCKEIIITNEDPYDEDPMSIIEQVAQGTGGRAQKILDRREAIRSALKQATLYDTVIITGKGSEPWMCVKNNKKIPWDDCQIAREELIKIEQRDLTISEE